MKIVDRLFKVSDRDFRPGKISVPSNLAFGETCALLVFNHGIGEAGDGSLANVWKLFANPQAMGPIEFAMGTDDFAFVNPLTKKVKKFIVVSLQGIGAWCLFVDQLYYAIEKDIKLNYPIDPRAVFMTGLSAGGGTTADFISSDYGSIVAAAVPFSPASGGWDHAKTAANNTKVWVFYGNADAYSYYQNSKYIFDQVNSRKPGNARLSPYNGGHGNWNLEYNPAYKESIPVNGVDTKLNIYEWMLMNSEEAIIVAPGGGSGGTGTTTPSDGQVIVVPPNNPVVVLPGDVVVDPPVLPLPVVELPTANAGPDIAMLSVASNDVFGAMDGTKSTPGSGRKLVSYLWTLVSGPAGFYLTNDKSAYTYIKWVSPGTYVFRLKVTDDKGNTATDDMTVTVTSSKPAPVLVSYEIRAVYDNQTKGDFQILAKDKITLAAGVIVK